MFLAQNLPGLGSAQVLPSFYRLTTAVTQEGSLDSQLRLPCTVHQSGPNFKFRVENDGALARHRDLQGSSIPSVQRCLNHSPQPTRHGVLIASLTPFPATRIIRDCLSQGLRLSPHCLFQAILCLPSAWAESRWLTLSSLLKLKCLTSSLRPLESLFPFLPSPLFLFPWSWQILAPTSPKIHPQDPPHENPPPHYTLASGTVGSFPSVGGVIFSASKMRYGGSIFFHMAVLLQLPCVSCFSWGKASNYPPSSGERNCSWQNEIEY